jgi:hypothetical protein
VDAPIDYDLTFTALASAPTYAIDVDIRTRGRIKYGSASFNFDSFVIRLKNNFKFFRQTA